MTLPELDALLSQIPARPESARSVVPSRGGRPRHRHRWVRVLATDGPVDGQWVCLEHEPPLLRDEMTSRRGRTSAKRGKAIQRQRITGLGGRNLAGNNPNLDGIGELFRYESKSGLAFPERPWRWLKDIRPPAGQIGVLVITDTNAVRRKRHPNDPPGNRARSIVIVDYDDWRDLHGELVP